MGSYKDMIFSPDWFHEVGKVKHTYNNRADISTNKLSVPAFLSASITSIILQ